MEWGRAELKQKKWQQSQRLQTHEVLKSGAEDRLDALVHNSQGGAIVSLDDLDKLCRKVKRNNATAYKRRLRVAQSDADVIGHQI